jgi:hypothetical protein
MVPSIVAVRHGDVTERDLTRDRSRPGRAESAHQEARQRPREGVE